MRLFIALMLFFSIGNLHSQSLDLYKEAYLKKWENTENYLLEVIKQMPEDKLDFKPTDEAKTFREITIHIISNMVWLSTDYLDGKGFENEYKTRDLSKDQLVEVIQSAFKYSSQALTDFPDENFEIKKDFFAGPMDTYQILRLMNDHLSHHRGQLTLHLRLNNLPVPRYVGW